MILRDGTTGVSQRTAVMAVSENGWQFLWLGKIRANRQAASAWVCRCIQPDLHRLYCVCKDVPAGSEETHTPFENLRVSIDVHDLGFPG